MTQDTWRLVRDEHRLTFKIGFALGKFTAPLRRWLARSLERFRRGFDFGSR